MIPWMLAVACVSRAPSPPPGAPLGPTEGTWDLSLPGDPPWQHHALALEGVVDGRLRGRLWLDRSLGPDGQRERRCG